jgi:hypothetical protein
MTEKLADKSFRAGEPGDKYKYAESVPKTMPQQRLFGGPFRQKRASVVKLAAGS